MPTTDRRHSPRVHLDQLAYLNIEPETALRKANYKFEQRFRTIEQEPGFECLSLDQKEVLWAKAKKAHADSIA